MDTRDDTISFVEDRNDIKQSKPQQLVRSITSTEFEQYCKNVLEGFAECEELNNFHITHDVKMKAYDGTYQVDVFASFTALGSDMKVICECKQYTNPVKRDDVVLLYNRVQALGCQKGLLLATSDFQKGAIEFAKEHGIALIKVYDNDCMFYSHASNNENRLNENDPFYIGEQQLPSYRAECYLPDKDITVPIYPTRKMIASIINKMSRSIYGSKAFQLPEE